MSIYVDNFLLALNTMQALKKLKNLLAKKYKIKDFRKVQIIIGWQIIRNELINTMKINYLIFIRDLVTKKRFIDYNAYVILIKTRSTIEMSNLDNYKETKFYKY